MFSTRSAPSQSSPRSAEEIVVSFQALPVLHSLVPHRRVISAFEIDVDAALALSPAIARGQSGNGVAGTAVGRAEKSPPPPAPAGAALVVAAGRGCRLSGGEIPSQRADDQQAKRSNDRLKDLQGSARLIALAIA